MAESTELPVSDHHGARLLMRDLTRIAGTLREVATAWRQADLDPEGVPPRLEESVRRLAATVAALTSAKPGESLDLAVSAATQLARLRDGIADARLHALDAGRQAGDKLLWEEIREATDRAVRQCLSLVIERSAVADWEISDMTNGTDGAVLFLRLGAT